ncbi:MAG: CRISPR-associated endonuclease Cas1 [Methanobacteriales archaeon Met13]
MRLVVDGYGKSLGKRDNQIVVKDKGHEVNYFLAEELSQVIITGKGSVSFDAMNLMATNNVDLVVLNWTGDIIYRLSPPELKNVRGRREQFHAYNDSRSGFLCKQFIGAKMENQKSVLGSLAKSRDYKNPGLSSEILKSRDRISDFLDKIHNLENKPIDELRGKIFGLEGQASIEYWKGVSKVVNPNFGFFNRSGRGATDGVNSMLNYGYGILRGYVWRSVHLAALDPYAGYLHADRWGRASLVFDLIEEFRQQVVDRTVLSLVNLGKVKPSQFHMEGEMCLMSDKVRLLLISSTLDKMDRKIKVDGKSISWAELINHQAQLLTKYLVGETQYTGFYQRW